MIKKLRIGIILVMFLLGISNAVALPQKESLIVIPADEMTQWGKPKTLPEGAYDYLLSGNPGKPEIFTFRFQLPENYKIPPFLFTSKCYLTIISGALYIGTGDKFVNSKQHELSAGSFVVIPANIPLYFWTKEKTILQFNGIGPLDVNYVDPSEDPRNRIKTIR